MKKNEKKTQNKIKLACVLVLAMLFMVTFTCCVKQNQPNDSGNLPKGQETLFTPPDTSADRTEETTTDVLQTEPPIVTMPPTSDTETTKAPGTTQEPETSDIESGVYGNFSGLY